MTELVQFILKHLDHDDEKAVEEAYDLYREYAGSGFLLCEWMDKTYKKKADTGRPETAGEIYFREKPVEDKEPEIKPDNITVNAAEAYDDEKDIFARFFEKTEKIRRFFIGLIRGHRECKQKKLLEKRRKAFEESAMQSAFCEPDKNEEENETICMPSEDITWQRFYPAEGNFGGVIYLRGNEHVIGKSANYADLVIEERSVSRCHARVKKRGGEYYIEDCNSTNGTQINGRILKPQEEAMLKKGDRVSFGTSEYIYQ